MPDRLPVRHLPRRRVDGVRRAGVHGHAHRVRPGGVLLVQRSHEHGGEGPGVAADGRERPERVAVQVDIRHGRERVRAHERGVLVHAELVHGGHILRDALVLRLLLVPRANGEAAVRGGDRRDHGDRQRDAVLAVVLTAEEAGIA